MGQDVCSGCEAGKEQELRMGREKEVVERATQKEELLGAPARRVETTSAMQKARELNGP